MVTEQNRRLPDSSEVESSRMGPAPLLEGPSISCEAFLLAFNRSFGRVYSYVSRRLGDRATCERIVKEVLIENLDHLVAGSDEKELARRLKASTDRLIKRETALSVAAPGLQY